MILEFVANSFQHSLEGAVETCQLVGARSRSNIGEQRLRCVIGSSLSGMAAVSL
jgi:hypothetical protein